MLVGRFAGVSRIPDVVEVVKTFAESCIPVKTLDQFRYPKAELERSDTDKTQKTGWVIWVVRCLRAGENLTFRHPGRASRC